MTDDLRPYSEYKDSCLPWLGDIPKHWSIARTKRHFRLRIEKSPAGHGRELLSIYTHIGVRPRKELEQKGNKASNTDGYWIVRSGDIIVNKLLAWMGAIGVSHYDGVTSPAYDILMPVSDDVESDYFHYLFRTGTYLQQFKARSRGIMEMRLRLYFDEFGQIPVLVPPRAEQQAIVRFLDTHSRHAIRFLRNRRQLIELLNEQKYGIINEAVTRGLDRSAPLIASGVDWLGDVPSHWKIRKLKSLFLIHGSGTTPSSDEYYGGEVPWVMTGDLNDSQVTVTKQSVISRALADFSALRLYPAGSLIVALYGATIGKTGILAVDACTNQACCVLARPTQEANVRFLQAVALLAKPHLVRLSYGGGQPNINSEIVRSLRVPVPPMTEQSEIIAYIDERTATINHAIATAQREMELIHEYLNRFIADVVTGKIDVSQMAAQLDSVGLEDFQELLENELEGVEEDDIAEEALNADD